MGASSALADDTDAPAQDAESFVPGWTSQEAQEEALIESDPEVVARPPTNFEAAEALPHNDLGRAEASHLFTAVFGEVVDEAAGIFNGDLEVEQFHSDHVAVVAADESAPVIEGEAPPDGLLSSLLPLRTEDSEGVEAPVDLSLTTAEGEIQPENPLAEVGIPIDLNDGIVLPEAGVTIDLQQSPPGRTASILDDSAAFYPNVAPDSDLTVVPTPTGVETSTILRTPAAPLTQTFALTIPPGAHLQSTKEGGASVIKAGETLLSIRTPAALDAEGDPVSVALDVVGSSIVISTSPTEGDAFPILVDPIYESYFWNQYPNDHSPEWIPGSSSPLFQAWWSDAANPGLNLLSRGGWFAPGTQATWNYYVPRFFTDKNNPEVNERPKTYIRRMTLSQVEYDCPTSQPHPFLIMGLWSETKSAWVWSGSRDCIQGPLFDLNYQYPLDNPYEVPDAKNGGIALSTVESNVPDERYARVGQATVEIADKDNPTVWVLGRAEQWVNEQPTSTINYNVEDPGLGIYELRTAQPQLNGTTTQIPTSAQCNGSARQACPRILLSSTRALKYDPKVMPQGENEIFTTVVDPIGHAAPVVESRVKVDHTKPALALSGSLTEQAKVGTAASEYALKYVASDGDSTTPTALAPFGTAGTGVGKLQRPMGVAVDNGGNTYVVDRECKCVQKYSASGAFISQFGSPGTGPGQFSDPRGIAWSSGSARVLVTDIAKHSVQIFTSTGGFVREITKSGMDQPFAIAGVPSQEKFWVTDLGSHKVFRISDAGVVSATVTGTKADPNEAGTDFMSPGGVAVSTTSLVVTDSALNRVFVFDTSGKFVTQFGSTGTGQGQLREPIGVGLASSGNILVGDSLNNRIEEFRIGGQFIRQFGSSGSSSGQLSEPRGLVLGPDNVAYIADAANKRIAKWSHADYDPQSGAASTEIKLDGVLVQPKHVPGCATKDCTIDREWSLKADQYPVGAHTVTVTATDGVGLATSKSLSIETHGDLLPPEAALSGSMTQQASLGTTRPSYTVKVVATDPGGAQERKSGVSSATIKVDGEVVDSLSPGCPGGGCSITREWTMNSNAYAVGSHSISVTITDAAGRATTKTWSITINRDSTPPQLTATGNLFTAPDGWVDQKAYAYAPVALDPNGYGVTSMVLKIDGTVVKSAGQLCPNGGCGINPVSTLDMAAYSGGAHPAELIATDGAGNASRKEWTINVNPDGEIPAGEASDTIEALEASVDETPVAPIGEVLEPGQMNGGDNPSMIEVDGDIESRGVPNSTVVADDPADGMTIEGPEYTLTITPLAPPDDDPTIITEEIAAIRANFAKETDLVARPQYNGAMQFAMLRDETAPETFSWKMHMEPEQALFLVNDSTAEVRYTDNDHRAFLIVAEVAHDATGAAVGTKLSVSGDVLTMTVLHRGKGFVYPVIAGEGFETSYKPGFVTMPPTKAEEEEASEGEGDPFAVPYPPSVGNSISSGELRRWRLKPRSVTGTVAPPVATASRERIFEVDEKTCHPDTCLAWEIWQHGTLFKRFTESVEWEYGQSFNCRADIDWPFGLSTTVVAVNTFYAGVWAAKKGTGKHLTTWCHYEIDVWAHPHDFEEFPGVPDSHDDRSMQIWIWPNGYQEPHTYQWNNPENPEIREN